MTPVAAATRFLQSCPPGALVLVAVSGGSDSTGLLLALRRAVDLSARSDISLQAATIDHDLRAGSAEEAAQVAAFCRSLSIPHHLRRWQGEKPKTGLPAAARLARYRLLAEIAGETGASCVVTGHTINDQQETIAMRAGRSAADAPGLSGMAPAMLFNRTLWVVRPFLHVGRQAIRDFLTGQGQSWFDDPTNENMAFERARIRRDMQASVQQVSEPGELQAQARRETAEAITVLLKDACRIEAGVLASLDRNALAQHAQGLASLGLMVAVMGGRSHLPGQDSLARLAPLLAGQGDGSLTLSRTVVTFHKDKIHISREARDLPVISVAPHTTEVWDGRFRITNHGEHAVQVSGGQSVKTAGSQTFPSLPPFVAIRAAKALPHVDGQARVGQTGIKDAEPARVMMEPLIPLFDLFLPIFELPVANCISQLLQRSLFSPFPLHYI